MNALNRVFLFTALPAALIAPPAAALPRYAVQDLASGEVVRRGEQLSTGIRRGEVILAPNSYFRVWVLDPETRRIGYQDLTTPRAGRTFSLDEVVLRASASVDRDGDGLSDEAEFILGSDSSNSDTDGDGVLDGAALALGLDPVTGAITGAITGVIGGTGTTGEAIDIAARNDLAVIAKGSAGITVFNIFNRMLPIVMADVDTPGSALRVEISGNFVAVADGLSGLLAIDVSDPPTASITQQVQFGSEVVAVAASNEFAYAALANGEVATIALRNGQIFQRTLVGNDLQDLAIAGDTLYALSAGFLHPLPLTGNLFTTASSFAAPGSSAVSPRRLHSGGDRAYCSHDDGYNVFALADPAAPFLLNDVRPGTIRWGQIVANGSGLGVAVYPTNLIAQIDTHLHSLSSDALGDAFVTSFEGGSRTVQALAIYNGQAYLASGASGIEVLNYLAVDTAGVPPVITLETTATGGVVQEGQPVRVTAAVSDDVQVRNVEFYVDGARIATDGNHPFEVRFNAPRDDGGDASFRLAARASDTGGNATWTGELSIGLGPDTTAPLATQTFPPGNGIVGQFTSATLVFSEALDPATVTIGNIFLVEAGPDQVPGTADDTVVPAQSVSISDAVVILTYAAPVPAGRYFFEVTAAVRDLAGNAASEARLPSFRVVPGEDPDQDGLPTDVENLLGLDPLDPDSDDDGINDGAEDNDGEGLGNAIELVLGLDPLLPDTDGNGTLDRDEDPDQDGISTSSVHAIPNGSTGADGALDVTENTTRQIPDDGVFNFTTINIAAGVTLTFQKNADNTPIYLLATGEVNIEGTINISGGNGGTNTIGIGGPGGGFDGGAPPSGELPAGTGMVPVEEAAGRLVLLPIPASS